jgi:hypothetical protein
MATYTVYYARGFADRNPPATLKLANYAKITAVEATGLEDVFRQMNVVDGTEMPVRIHCRSMSVGDVVVDEAGAAHFVCSAGWQIVALES